MDRKQRLQERNQNVRMLFDDLSKKNPQWRTSCVIDEIAKQVYLSSRTVEAILKHEGVYKDSKATV